MMISKSSHRKCSVRKYILRNLVKLTWKHLCQSLFFVFSCEFYEISKNPFFTEHLHARLLLNLFTHLKQDFLELDNF